MKKLVNYTVLSLALLLLLIVQSQTIAQERTTNTQLQQAGVDMNSFQPITWSHNDKWLACFDKASFKDKKDGVFYRLWLFQLSNNGATTNIRKVPLKLSSFEQAQFSPKDDALIILGNRGTTWQRLDMKTFEVTNILAPHPHRPGFRSSPTVVWTKGPSFYTVGYAYNKDRFIKPRTIATLDTNKTGPGAFSLGPNLSELEKGIERMWMANYMSPSSIFYGQRFDDSVVLSHWDGNEIKEFDRYPSQWGAWAAADKILYSIKLSDELSELRLFDVGTGSKVTIASSPQVYRYIFLSNDGSTAIASLNTKEGDRTTTYYARANDDWKLHPISVENGRESTLASGYMRVSTRGKMLAHVSPAGVVVYNLP